LLEIIVDVKKIKFW